MPVRSWDIFCTVIDNFGDIGVCWRLSRQLVAEHSVAVRLWVDDLTAFKLLEPRVDPHAARQSVAGVTICQWNVNDSVDAAPADVVIEAFACTLPQSYLASMARAHPAPMWINLEYLSAEDWVSSCHGLPSKHPQLGLDKYFFFPGFTAQTGGVLKEAGLDERRKSFESDSLAQQRFWLECGVPAPLADELCISLFAYENSALPDMLNAWSAGNRRIYCAVPVGRALPAISAWSQDAALQPGSVIERGSLRVVILPFLDQAGYDRLLWACELNFVRGEDSFVRAQLAQRPFVWQIYPQQENAHWPKLEAFLKLYSEGLETPVTAAFWHAWNGHGSIASAWPDFCHALPALRQHGSNWSEKLATHGDLAANLVHFCNQS